MKFNLTFQKEMEERGTDRINDHPEARWGYIYMCAKDILEKWDKLCEMKEEIRRAVGSDFFQETTKVTLMTLKLALEPLFFALEFLHNDRLNISSFCGIYFGIAAQLRNLVLALTFLQGHSSVNWKQSLEQQQSVTSALQHLQQPLTLSQRLSR